MYQWIWNKKRQRPLIFLFSMIIYSVNLALINVSIYMYLCIYTGIHTDWYSRAMINMSETDYFFSSQSEVIFQALIITFLCVCIFAAGIMMGYRYMQLKEEEKEIGTFLVCGYSRKSMILPVFAEGFLDLAVSIPFSKIIAVYIQYFIGSDEIFFQILRERAYTFTDSVVTLLFSAVISGFVLLLQSVFFVNGLRKKQLSIMLKGVQKE